MTTELCSLCNKEKEIYTSSNDTLYCLDCFEEENEEITVSEDNCQLLGGDYAKEN